MELNDARILILAFLSLVVGYYLLTSIVFAAVIAFVALPLFKALNGALKQKNLAAGISTLIVFSIVILPIALVIKTLAQNAAATGAMLQSTLANLGKPLAQVGLNAGGEAYAVISQKVVGVLSSFLVATPYILIQFFVLIILVFFFMRDGDRIKKYAKLLAKNQKQLGLIDEIQNLLKAVLIGYFGTAILIGAIAWLGFWVMGYEYAVVLAFIVMLGALLPVIGVWLAYVPLTLYEYMMGNHPAAVVVLGFGILLQVLELWLGPKIASMKAHMHPALLLVGFIGGPLAFGFVGIVLGPLILGTMKIVLDYYEFPKKK